MSTPAPVEGEGEGKGLPFWIELPLLVAVALVVALVIKTFLVQAFWIPSTSMAPTLQVDDRVLVGKVGYRFGEPEPGDIVVFRSPYEDDTDGLTFLEAAGRAILESVGVRPRGEPEDFIKRVIAVEGQEVEIRDNFVIVDGVPRNEPYLAPGSTMPDMAPVTIPEGHLWMMGDNRNHSSDSRVFGAVPVDDVVGQAFVLMWPVSRWTSL